MLAKEKNRLPFEENNASALLFVNTLPSFHPSILLFAIVFPTICSETPPNEHSGLGIGNHRKRLGEKPNR
jgi:hypothetical protein